ncbi:MAG: hypothetical protein ABI556_08160 [Gemmatimonadales bacterium]
MTAISAACTEKLDNSAGCPILCPDQGGEIETVTLDAVSLDSTVSALTGQGTETSLFLANRGDTLDSRAVIRFDSIPARFVKPGSDTTSFEIQPDSVVLRMIVDTVGGKIPGAVTLDLYDVDTNAADSLVAPVAALFRSDRLIVSTTLEKTALKDTIRVTLPPATIGGRKLQRLRIGIRARSTGSVQFRLLSQEGATTPTQLTYRVSPDTTVSKVTLNPYSKTPANQPIIANALADYTLLVKGTPVGPPTTLNIGGLPASRVYMRFIVPSFLIDSVDVVRATLLLTQLPNSGLDATDTVRIIPNVSLAAVAVTDLAKAAQITALGSTDTLKVEPGGSGVRSAEVASIVGIWRFQKETDTPRAIILVSTREGQSPLEGRFYSIEASPDRRPRLRISYSTRKSTGLP